MKILVDAIYYKLINGTVFDEIEHAKLRYSIELIINESLKIMIIYIISSMMGYQKEFGYTLLLLVMLRTFSGGLHFKSFYGCLVFSVGYFLSVFALSSGISLNNIFSSILFTFSFTTIFFLAPIPHNKRPSYPADKANKFKKTSLLMVLLHFIGYFCFTKNPYLELSVWGISLQSLQLLIAKGVNYFEKRTMVKTS